LGITYFQFIPICGKNGLKYPGGIAGWEWGTFLVDIFREWLKYDTDKVGIQIFDECMRAVLGERATTCVHSEGCGGFVVEANGDVFCCEHFVEEDEINSKLGNVFDSCFHEMAHSIPFLSFNSYKLSQDCSGCEYYYLCYGGCIRHRAHRFNRSNLCDGYKRLFQQFLTEIVPLR
jgi:uncharacterized protein